MLCFLFLAVACLAVCSADSTFLAVLAYAKSNNTVIDVGSHGGQEIKYSINGGARRIFGVECHPRAYADLIKMFWDDERVTILNGCAAAEHGIMELSLAVDSSSLIKENTINHKGALIKRPKKSRQSLYVQTLKLDDVLRGVDDIAMIKIDVQGAEYMVLEGLTNILKTQKPIVLYEHYMDPEQRPLKMLTDLGYSCQMACKKASGCPDKVCIHDTYKPTGKVLKMV